MRNIIIITFIILLSCGYYFWQSNSAKSTAVSYVVTNPTKGLLIVSTDTSGQVIGKDTTSITVKTMDGSSKIVFLAPTTHTVKSVDTTANDVQMGMNVFVTGTANSDGSVTAQNIQIRQNSAAGMVTQNPASAEMPINPAAVGISPTLFPIATPITR